MKAASESVKNKRGGGWGAAVDFEVEGQKGCGRADQSEQQRASEPREPRSQERWTGRGARTHAGDIEERICGGRERCQEQTASIHLRCAAAGAVVFEPVSLMRSRAQATNKPDWEPFPGTEVPGGCLVACPCPCVSRRSCIVAQRRAGRSRLHLL